MSAEVAHDEQHGGTNVSLSVKHGANRCRASCSQRRTLPVRARQL